MSGDVFGQIYEYFLTQFADQKAHDAGEFFTPISLVSLIAHVLDPERGTVLDPACGSGGMFVQSARIVEEHGQSPTEQLTFRGLEKNATTMRSAKMNLAVHGLEGDIQQANTYYEAPTSWWVRPLAATPPPRQHPGSAPRGPRSCVRRVVRATRLEFRNGHQSVRRQGTRGDYPLARHTVESVRTTSRAAESAGTQTLEVSRSRNVPSRFKYIEVFAEAIADVDTAPATDVPAGPPFFRFSDEDELTEFLRRTGFEEICIQTLEFDQPFESTGIVWSGLLDGTARTGATVHAQTARSKMRSMRRPKSECRHSETAKRLPFRCRSRSPSAKRALR